MRLSVHPPTIGIGRGAAPWLPVIAAAVAVSGCGGGSDAAAGPAPGSPSGGWVAGVFQPSASFEAQCLRPRTGSDPAGVPYGDLQGSVVSENNWLRSWSNELYLWYDEIVDRDPGAYSTTTYFDLLKTTAITASGTAKDQFHFTVPTDEWERLAQSGVSAGYGAQWSILATRPPRSAVAVYVEAGSPAAMAPADIARGDRLLAIDGVDFVSDNTQAGVDTLNAALSPSGPGQTHVFEIEDLSLGGRRSFTLTSAEVLMDPVPTVATIDTGAGIVGYMLFNDHLALAEQALIDAVDALAAANVTDLVLDIRYNGGGYLVIASQIAYMIAGDVPTGGGSATFEETRFNAKHPITNPVTGAPLVPTPFVTRTVGLSAPAANVPLPTLDLQRVFVLTGSGTCSASEAIINGLRGVDVEVIQIGSTTCGKPYGFYPMDNCGTTYFSIQFQGVNAKGFGDYTDGFTPANTALVEGSLVPGCSVADDYNRPLGDPAEGRFAAALGYRATGTCPLPTGITAPGLAKTHGVEANRDGHLIRPPWRENRILEH